MRLFLSRNFLKQLHAGFSIILPFLDCNNIDLWLEHLNVGSFSYPEVTLTWHASLNSWRKHTKSKERSKGSASANKMSSYSYFGGFFGGGGMLLGSTIFCGLRGRIMCSQKFSFIKYFLLCFNKPDVIRNCMVYVFQI